MKKNLIIDYQGVAIQFDGFYCDIHNEYDLVRIDIDYRKKSLLIIFERNQFSGALAKVKTLGLEAIGVDYLNININTLDMSNEYIEEIGYKKCKDFEVDYLLYDDTFEDSDHLVIYLGSKSLIRDGKGIIRLHSSTLTAVEVT